MPIPELQSGAADIPHLLIELLDRSNYAFQPLSLLHFAAAAVILSTGIFILWWERGSRVARMFGTFSVLFTLWQVGRGAMRLATDPALEIMLSRYLYALIAIAAPVLFQFVMVMLRAEQRRLALIRLNWLIGIVFAIAAVGTGRVVSRIAEMPWGLEPQHGVLGAGIVFWLCVIIAVGLSDLYHAWARCLPGTVERRRIGLFGLAVISLCLTLVDFLTASGVPVYPFGFATSLVFVLMTAHITRVYGLVEVTAQLAASEIAAMTRGALLILDAEGVIRVVNDRIASTLGRTQAELIGRPAQALLGEAISVSGLSLLARLEGDVEKDIPYSHPVSGQALDLSMTVTAVHNRGREVAYVCVLRDVTGARRVERDRLMDGLQDALTGLPNRAMFLGLVDAAVERARKSPDYTFAVCFLGINRMRVINEDLGYATGDRVLAEFALRLRRVIRPQDAVARIGGDEFGVLMRGHGGDADVRAYAERLNQALREPLALEDHKLFLAASIGVASHDHVQAGGAELLRRAGMAMYHAKEDGDSVQFVAAPDLGPQRTRLEAELHRALEQDELRVYYQPIIDLQERRVSGFEALVRWQHPQRGLLLPQEFIDFAEEVGLIAEIDRFVLRQACLDLASLRDRYPSRCTVSVNFAEATLLDPRVVEQVQEALADAQVSAEALRVEVLERVAQIGRVHDALSRMRRLGVGLYIDDFGTGYSALSRLHQLPASTLKIDREFVRAMSLHAGGQKIIAGILALAASLGLEVIAEGCAIGDEAAKLHELGCRYVQGFYFSAAVPLESAAEMFGEPAVLRQCFEQIGLGATAERRRVG